MLLWSFTDGHIISAHCELTMLLAQRATLTAAMNQAIPTRGLPQRVLLPHLWPVEARVEAWTTNHTANKRVQGSASTTSCTIIWQNHINDYHAMINKIYGHLYKIHHLLWIYYTYRLILCPQSPPLDQKLCKGTIMLRNLREIMGSINLGNSLSILCACLGKKKKKKKTSTLKNTARFLQGRVVLTSFHIGEAVKEAGGPRDPSSRLNMKGSSLGRVVIFAGGADWNPGRGTW